ncbi:MAG: hypothetical protein KGM49_07530 [Sphingomonadales bacterium]|nr:hypothetical protein [Sphingomonadales bacterium]
MPRKGPFPPASDAEIKAELQRRAAPIALPSRNTLPHGGSLSRWVSDRAGDMPDADAIFAEVKDRIANGTLLVSSPVIASGGASAIERETARLYRLAITERLTAWAAMQPTTPSPEKIAAKIARDRDEAIEAATAPLGHDHLTTKFMFYTIERAREAGGQAIRFGDGTRGPVQNLDDLAWFIETELGRGSQEVKMFKRYIEKNFPNEIDKSGEHISIAAAGPEMAKRGVERALGLIKSGVFNEYFEISRQYELATSQILDRELVITATTSFKWDDATVLTGDVFTAPERIARAMCKGVGAVARAPTAQELRSSGF